MLPQSDTDKEKIKNAVVEYSNSLLRQESERDLQKNICDRIKDEVGVEPKYLKQLAKVYHKQNYSELKLQSDEFESLYEVVFK